MNAYLIEAIKASLKAGKAIMDIYNKDFIVDFKEDASPLTEADRASDGIISSCLKKSFPILSEEGKHLPYEERKKWTTFWLVDPLDGTKEFIKKNGEFTVNIALITDGIPVMGVVYVPATAQLYFAAEGLGAYYCTVSLGDEIQDIQALLMLAIRLDQVVLPDLFTVVASRSHLSPETETYINECRRKHGAINLVSKGSSLKLCLVAEGKAHVYPRIAPTMEWDTAAAHAVAKYAGCSVFNFETGEELTYNKQNLLNPHFIVRNER